MDMNLNNIGRGSAAYVAGGQIAADGLETAGKTGGADVNGDLRLSGVRDLDVLQGSEPVAAVPESALSRDDDLGRIVHAAFNLPPPPPPDFS